MIVIKHKKVTITEKVHILKMRNGIYTTCMNKFIPQVSTDMRSLFLFFLFPTNLFKCCTNLHPSSI